jgi:hypothetical protein
VTSDVPCRPLVQPERVRSNQKARIASTTPPSRGKVSALRSVFHQQVLPNPMLAHDAQEPATVLGGVAISEPASGDLLRSPLNARQVPTCVVLRRIVPGRPALPVVQDLRPGRWQIRYAACQLLQSPRFLSTTMDLTDTPHAPPRVTPLRCADAGSVASFEGPANAESPGRRVAGRAVTGSGAGETPSGVAGASRRTKRGSLAPTLIDPDTSCHDLVSMPGRRSRTQSGWDNVPTSSPADSARPSAPGLHHPTFREEGQDSRTRGVFHQQAAPKGWLMESTGCHQSVEYPRAAPF